MTGKEAAKINENAPGGRDQILQFLETAPAREIQQYIHGISVDPMSHMYQRARVALDIRLSEDADIMTRRIICLTWALLILTAVLLVVAAVPVIFH